MKGGGEGDTYRVCLDLGGQLEHCIFSIAVLGNFSVEIISGGQFGVKIAPDQY